MSGAFFDSNVLIYTATAGDPRRPTARALLDRGGVISTQCLNEFAAVGRRKLGLDWETVRSQLEIFQSLCRTVVPLDIVVHRLGIGLADRYGFSVWDAMIVVAALVAGCDTLYSEDMHAGLVVDGRLTIVNPFAA